MDEKQVEHPLRSALREFCLNQIGNDSLIEDKLLSSALADVLDYIAEDYSIGSRITEDQEVSRYDRSMADDIQRIAAALRRV